MKLEEFNRKWNNKAYTALMERKDDWAEEYAKYLEDCYSMYEETGFTPTFKSIYSSYPKQYNGLHFKVLRRATPEDGFDLECLPAWEVEFENGERFICFPEEICKAEHCQYKRES